MIQVFIVGCGDIGRRVGARHIRRGEVVVGLVRSAQSAEPLAAEGIRPVVSDLDAPLGRTPGPHGALVYYLAPPPNRGQHATRLRDWLHTIAVEQLPRKVVYISTSGVYGDCGGEWVDEHRTPRPQTDRARRRLHAEQVLAAWSRRTAVPVVVLRVGGIYGPGRLPIERLRGGHAVLREEDCGFSNRIHSEDLASVAVAAADDGPGGAIYNVSDGRPGTMTEYFNAVADLLQLPRPPAVSWDEAERRLGAEMMSYLRESRRLSTARMRRELNVALRYPDLAAGLRSCV